MKFSILSATLIAIVLFIFSPVYADDLPSCYSAGQDADGDGFGWVVNPEQGQQPHSCVVNDSSQPMPSITNRETSQPVQFIRAYWDANKDLANKTLECEAYRWSEDEQEYLLLESYQRFHYPLPNEKPWIYAWTKSDTVSMDGGIPAKETLLWTVVDGVLNDLLQFISNAPSRYWVELISVNGGVENATRWWYGNLHTSITDDQSYYQCTDPVSNQFIPTGSPGVASAAASGTSDEPAIFTTVEEFRQSNLSQEYDSNGMQAVMTRGGAWDIQKLAYKPISCPRYDRSYIDDDRWFWRFNDPADYTLMFLPPRADAPNSGFVAAITLHFGARHAQVSPWTISADNTIEHPYAFGRSDWFVLASTHSGRDELHYDSRTCSFKGRLSLNGVLLESAYMWRDMTDEEHHEALLIRTNVDTSHCTSADEVENLGLGGNTCIAQPVLSTNQIVSDPLEGQQPDTESTMSSLVNSSNTDNQTIENSSVSTSSGGGVFHPLAFLLLIGFLTAKELVLRQPQQLLKQRK